MSQPLGGVPRGAQRRRRGWAAAAVLAAALGAVGVGTPPAMAADGCPNAAIRAEQGALALPDCRAYEQVSPVAKGGANVFQSAAGWPSAASLSPSGDGATFQTTSPLPDGQSGALFALATSLRSSDGWTTRSIMAAQRDSPEQIFTTTLATSPDQRTALVYSEKALADGAVDGNGNYYLLDVVAGKYRLLTTFAGPRGGTSEIDGALALSNGGTRVVLIEDRALTPDATAKPDKNVYEFIDGQPQLISDPEASITQPAADSRVRALSADGSQVVFQQDVDDADGFGIYGVYLSKDGQPGVPLAVSRRPGDPTTPYKSRLVGASKDGRLIFFASMGMLTPETVTDGFHLYRYDVEHDELVDLTPDSAPWAADGPTLSGWNEGAGLMSPVSEDGSYVYFRSFDQLTADAVAGQTNLYGLHGGELRLLATAPYALDDVGKEWSLSPDGTKLAFLSVSRLTAYDNTGPDSNCPGTVVYNPGKCAEVYLYDWSADHLSCASCPSNGTDLPQGHAMLGGFRDFGHESSTKIYPSLVLDDGTVLFDTPQRLVAQDVNGQRDVYAYRQGQVQLISGGRGAGPSVFSGMTPDASSVFFSTGDQLVGQDRDTQVDLYAARVDGGLVGQQAVEEAAPCVGDDCQGSMTPPVASVAAATVSFVGAGDPPERPATKARALKATVSKSKVVRGAKGQLKVRVPAVGSLSVSGSGVRSARRSASKAGSYSLSVALSARAQRTLRAKRSLTVSVRVGYTPKEGRASSVTVRVTFKATKKGGR